MSTAKTKTTQAVDRIDEVRAIIIGELPALFDQQRDKITEAITVAVEESQERAEESDNPAPAKLSFSISVKWDLDGRKVLVELPISIKTKAKASRELSEPPDPSRPMLPGIESDADGDPNPPRITEAMRRLGANINGGPDA